MVANVVSDQDGNFWWCLQMQTKLFVFSLSMKREEWEKKKRQASQNTSAAACIRWCEGQNNKTENNKQNSLPRNLLFSICVFCFVFLVGWLLFERGLNKSPKQVSTKSHMFLCMQDPHHILVPHIFCARGHELIWAMLLIMIIMKMMLMIIMKEMMRMETFFLYLFQKGRQCLISFPTVNI